MQQSNKIWLERWRWSRGGCAAGAECVGVCCVASLIVESNRQKFRERGVGPWTYLAAFDGGNTTTNQKSVPATEKLGWEFRRNRTPRWEVRNRNFRFRFRNSAKFRRKKSEKRFWFFVEKSESEFPISEFRYFM
jgi:hypothetical protein